MTERIQMQDSGAPGIEASAPGVPGAMGLEIQAIRPWEEEASFHDLLYDWMQRAPWLGLSMAAHLFVLFLLMSVPWEALRAEPERIFHSGPVPPPEEFFETPPEEEQLEPEVDERVEEPQLHDVLAEVSDQLDALEDVAEGEPSDSPSDTPFEEAGFNDLIGIGGSPGGKWNGRGLDGGPGGPGRATVAALQEGLDWLAKHQAEDGSWDCDGFSARCGEIGAGICEGEGAPTHDVGVTGLALLSFLGVGSTPRHGEYREVVRRGIAWLRDQQDLDTGRIGTAASHDSLYDHAIATLALCDCLYAADSPVLRRDAQAAVHFLQRARNRYGAWRYDVPPLGDNDTSITGWALFALAAARDAGLEVDPAAFEGGLAWLEEVTDPSTGRTGYDSRGSLSSRTPGNAHFPREKAEAMTAVSLLCRLFLGQDPSTHPILDRQADLLRRTPPVWDPEGHGCDMYAWYYATYAMFQMGGSHWRSWREAFEPVALGSQRKDGDAAGSWDPVGPWGSSGGRVYSTSMMALSLEATFRYGRVLGAR